MKKTLLFITTISLLFIQCGKENDSFLIKKGAIGGLTKTTMVKQIDSIFAHDSIVKLSPNENALGTQGEIEIYEKGGAKLLLLSPEVDEDPNSIIGNIQIFDNRYSTEKGLNLGSTFGDVKANYTIAAIDRTPRSVVVYLEGSDIFITIDNSELHENSRYNPDLVIEATQIPDEATFKYFMVGWDSDEE